MRGKRRATRRSKNSYIASRRKVTWQPIGWPSRSLKLAMLLRALAMTGLPPGDHAQILCGVIHRSFFQGGAHAHVDHDLLDLGTWWTFLYFRFSMKAGRTSLTYF